MAMIPTPGGVIRHVRKTVTFDGTAGGGEAGTRIDLFTTTGTVGIVRWIARTVTQLTFSSDTANILTVGPGDLADLGSSGFMQADSDGDADARNVAPVGSWWQEGGQPALGGFSYLDRHWLFDSDLKLACADYGTFSEAAATIDVTGGSAVFDFWYYPITDDGALAGDDHDADYDDYIEARVAAALATYDPPTKAELDSGLAGLNDLDAAGIRSAVGLSSANLDTQLSTIDNEIGVIDGVVDDILVDTAQIGAAGAGLSAIPWNSSWGAEVQSAATDALNAYDPPTKTELDSGFAGLNDLDAEGIRSAVGLASANLDTQLSTIDGEIGTIDGIVDDILEDTATTIPAALTTIDNEIEAIDTVVDAILADTAVIGAAGAGLTEAGGTGDQFTALPWNAAWGAEVQSKVADALAVYDPPTKAELDSGLAALENLSAAQVASEIADALSSDTLTEAYAASGAEATVAELLYMIWATVAQFSISGTTLTAKELDGASTALTFTLDDDTNPTSRVRSA